MTDETLYPGCVIFALLATFFVILYATLVVKVGHVFEEPTSFKLFHGGFFLVYLISALVLKLTLPESLVASEQAVRVEALTQPFQAFTSGIGGLLMDTVNGLFSAMGF